VLKISPSLAQCHKHLIVGCFPGFSCVYNLRMSLRRKGIRGSQFRLQLDPLSKNPLLDLREVSRIDTLRRVKPKLPFDLPSPLDKAADHLGSEARHGPQATFSNIVCGFDPI
jgi:hypothetical protein